MVTISLVLDHKLEFETHLGPEFLELEIPLPHLIDIGECLPDFRDRGVERSLDHNCFRYVCTHNHTPLIRYRTDRAAAPMTLLSPDLRHALLASDQGNYRCPPVGRGHAHTSNKCGRHSHLRLCRTRSGLEV